MILTKEVEVKPSGKMIQYYKDKGYNAKYHEPLIVKIKDLQEKSNIYIDVLCDMCKEKIMSVRYADYNRVVNKTGSYTCKDCSYIKMNLTSIVRYGDIYVKTDEFKQKRKKTCIDKYGVESPLQNEKIKENVRNTHLKKYGYLAASQVPMFKEKIKSTTFKHYGVDCASKSKEIKEKIRKTNLSKYGYSNPMQSPIIRAKANMTLCKNGFQKTSKQQLYLHQLYCTVMDAKLNFPISYYAVDICFPEEKLVVEYDGGGHDLRVTLGRLTEEEFNRKEIIRNNIIKREGYKQMRVISSHDLLPSDQVLLQMLSDARKYFSDYPNHSWIEFNIDLSTVRNAEHKNGISYNYGELQAIKKIS